MFYHTLTIIQILPHFVILLIRIAHIVVGNEKSRLELLQLINYRSLSWCCVTSSYSGCLDNLVKSYRDKLTVDQFRVDAIMPKPAAAKEEETRKTADNDVQNSYVDSASELISAGMGT
jgi:hypothetical protein